MVTFDNLWNFTQIAQKKETTTFRCQTIKYVDEEKIREKARLLFVSCSESSFLSTSAQCSFWCYIGEVLQLICRQWQKSAVGADSAVFTQQPRAVTHRSCRQRTTTPIHPDFVPSVRWPPPPRPLSWNFFELRMEIGNPEGPSATPSGGPANIRSWSENGKSSENWVDGSKASTVWSSLLEETFIVIQCIAMVYSLDLFFLSFNTGCREACDCTLCICDHW